MKSDYSSKKVAGYLLGLFLLFGIAMISGTTAQAQYPGGWGQDRNRDRDDQYRRDRDRRNRDDRYGRNGGYGNIYQIAQQRGYSDGLNVGAADGQRGQSYNPQRSHYFRDATDGYNSSYSNKGQYKQVFRNAFVQGYREGYQRYGNNRGRNNNGRWGNGSWFPW
jgi:hypothetical protein